MTSRAVEEPNPYLRDEEASPFMMSQNRSRRAELGGISQIVRKGQN